MIEDPQSTTRKESPAEAGRGFEELGDGLGVAVTGTGLRLSIFEDEKAILAQLGPDEAVRLRDILNRQAELLDRSAEEAQRANNESRYLRRRVSVHDFSNLFARRRNT
jgi:hypothetical protein